MSIATPSSAPETKNGFGRNMNRQIEFSKRLIAGELPDSSDLYDWAEQTNPENNGLTAWTRFSQQPMYLRYKLEEQELLKHLPEPAIQEIKRVPYIVDYACGDSMTTIHLLEQLLTEGTLSRQDLQHKEFIVFDSNPHAIASAKNNMQQFLGRVGCVPIPRVHAVLENRNTLSPPHTLLDKFTGDSFIFATGFTVGNLSEQGKINFANFDTRCKHTLLTSYFTKPTPEHIPYIEATYGKPTTKEELGETTITAAELESMYEAARRQINQCLQAAGWTPDELQHITITSTYHTDSGAIRAGFQLHEKIEKQIGNELFIYEPRFYPLYISQRFSSTIPPLSLKRTASQTGNFVAYDLYQLPHKNPRTFLGGMSASIGAALLAVLLLVRYQNDKHDQQLQTKKEQAILALMNQSFQGDDKDFRLAQTDTAKIDLFHSRVQRVGDILNIIYQTNKFTIEGSYFTNLENFLIGHLTTYEGITFLSADRFVSALQNCDVEMALVFIRQHPLLDAQLTTASNKLEELTPYHQALENSRDLNPEEEAELQDMCLGSEVKVIGSFPVLGHHIRNHYMLGELKVNGKTYIVSAPTSLLEIYKPIVPSGGLTLGETVPIQKFTLSNELGSFGFRNNRFIISGFLDLKEALVAK